MQHYWCISVIDASMEPLAFQSALRENIWSHDQICEDNSEIHCVRHVIITPLREGGPLNQYDPTTLERGHYRGVLGGTLIWKRVRSPKLAPVSIVVSHFFLTLYNSADLLASLTKAVLIKSNTDKAEESGILSLKWSTEKLMYFPFSTYHSVLKSKKECNLVKMHYIDCYFEQRGFEGTWFIF